MLSKSNKFYFFIFFPRRGFFIASVLTSDSTFACVFFIVGFLLGTFLEISVGNERWQYHLESLGHAEFYLDENNNRQWQLLDEVRKEEKPNGNG